MRAEKQFLVDEVAAQLASSNYLLLANFTGVTVENATSVRNQLRAHGAEYHVVKNSILNIAAKQAKLPDISGHLSGHTALVKAQPAGFSGGRFIKSITLSASMSPGVAVDLKPYSAAVATA